MISFYEFQQILENAHPYGDWEDHFDNDTEAGITKTASKTKNAPQGHRNAECSRCGNKEKAKLYDINAGKAKCKNCGGYLNLISK
jgi:late competence protein required for DNA uptake (superfamily II DNA/RNA helicase)